MTRIPRHLLYLGAALVAGLGTCGLLWGIVDHVQNGKAAPARTTAIVIIAMAALAVAFVYTVVSWLQYLLGSREPAATAGHPRAPVPAESVDAAAPIDGPRPAERRRRSAPRRPKRGR